MKITVIANQSLLDIAIQITGKAENHLKIARYNGVVPSEPLPIGLILMLPENLEIDIDIARYYNLNKLLPATELNNSSKLELIGKEGIDYWSLEGNFQVS